jgi:hypothetical protein
MLKVKYNEGGMVLNKGEFITSQRMLKNPLE